MLGSLPGLDVHYGRSNGVVACLLCWLNSIDHSVFGFSARIVGGIRRASPELPRCATPVITTVCALAGAALAWPAMVEVAAVHG